MSYLPAFGPVQDEFGSALVPYLVIHYIDISLYAFLTLLVLSNFWKIIIRHKMYEKRSFVYLYAFSVVCILLRLIFLIIFWYQSAWVSFLGDLQSDAKLCVGLI